MNRKIIQILMKPNGFLVALCDDGSVWYEDAPGVWLRTDTQGVEHQ